MEPLVTNRTFPLSCRWIKEPEESFVGLTTALQSYMEVQLNANAKESYKTECKRNGMQTQQNANEAEHKHNEMGIPMKC